LLLESKRAFSEGSLTLTLGLGLSVLFLGHLYDFTTLVVAAVRADTVGQALLTTVGAGGGAERGQSVVGAAAVSAALGKLTFWERCHVLL
jgi:hypothetical protein